MSKDLSFVIKKNLFFHQTHSFLVQDHLNIIFCFTPTYFLYSGVQSELCQASKMELFWKLVNSWKLLPIFARSFTLSYIIDRFKPLILSLIESNLGLVFSLLLFLKHFFSFYCNWCLLIPLVRHQISGHVEIRMREQLW